MPNINDFYNTQIANEFIRGLKPQHQRVDQLFTPVKTPDRKVTNIIGAYGVPISASVHAWDSTTEIASRDAINVNEIEKVLVKEQIPIREQDIMTLNDTNNKVVQSNIVKNLFNDAQNMTDRVLTRARAMAMEALTTGHVTAKNENNLVSIDIDYGLPKTHQEALLDANLWSVDTADIIGDILRWSMVLTDDGAENPAYILASRKTIAEVMKNSALKKAITGASVPRPLSLNEVNNFLTAQSLPKLVAFDEKYRKQKKDGTYEVIPFIPKNTVVLIPNGALGRQEFGPTAEEYELMGDKAYDVIAKQNVIVEVYRTPDPVARWTKAVTSCMPSFARANEVFVAAVGK